MKLVDILARELKVWPEGILLAVQDADGEIKFDNSHELPRLNSSGDVWIRQGDEGDSIYRLATASDYATAIVTRAEWQAAVDALYPKFAVPEEWNGEGLPPVGTVCEVMGGGLPSTAFDWERCTILLINEGADDKKQVCTRDFRGDLAIYYPEIDAVYFRPIRTPEQIAAEEREKGILQMAHDCGDWWRQESDAKCLPPIFAAMWKAGYRKFEIVEGE